MITEINGKKISPLGLGTWKMGGSGFAETTEDLKNITALKSGIENGITLIDTAEMYGDGHSEELVGKAITEFDRDDLFIVTKVWNDHLRHDDLLKSANSSLKRLNSGYIDLYLIHWPSPNITIKETISAMEELVDMGIIRNIGVSNFNNRLLQDAMDATKKYEIVVNQLEYNMSNRSVERDNLDFCRKNSVNIMAYSPLNQGNLKFGRKINETAERLGITPVQTILRYLMRNSIPIPKSSSPEHILEFVWAMKEELPDQYARAI